MGDGFELRNRKYNRNITNIGNVDSWIRGDYGYIKVYRLIEDDDVVEVIDRYKLNGNYISLFCEVSFKGIVCEDFRFGGVL